MNKFAKGQKLSTRSICNYDSIFKGEVISRTAKTVTIKTPMDGVSRVKIHTNEDGEFCFPHGRYSMAPTFKAPANQG